MSFDRIVLVCSEDHIHKINSVCRELGVVAEIIHEPSPKNTGPASLAATLRLAQTLDNFLFVLLPCDHYIDPEKAFLKL